MKPQLLQDAIKAAALQKTQRRQASGWKEPVVHEHKITAAEYKDLKSNTKMSPAMAAAPAAAPSNALIEQLQQDHAQLRQQMRRDKDAWGREKQELLQEMKLLRQQVAGSSSSSSSPATASAVAPAMPDMDAFRREVLQETKTLVQSMQQCHAREVESLRREVATLKQQSKSDDSSSAMQQKLDAFAQELALLKKQQKQQHAAATQDHARELESLRQEWAKVKKKSSKKLLQAAEAEQPVPKTPTRSPKTPTKNKAATPSSSARKPYLSSSLFGNDNNKSNSSPTSTMHHMSSTSSKLSPAATSKPKAAQHHRAPGTPKKQAKALPQLKPHSVADLAEAQRKDKALKEYLKTQSGELDSCYTYKSMSVADYHAKQAAAAGDDDDVKHLVLFENRLYVPAKLRQATMAHYVKNNPYDSATALQKHCIWPDMEQDLKKFRREQKRSTAA